MRAAHDFHGGIHPPENKHQSTGRSIVDAGVPPQLVLPLSQHIGAAAEPVVEVGQRVLKGQLIARSGGFVSVPLHAPSSGTVSAIEDRPIPHASGFSAPCIVIDTDGQDRWVEHAGVEDYRQLRSQDLLQRIRDAGIAGMGGAGFPTAVKLTVGPGIRIDTLIINGTECEPYITADDLLMRERAREIVLGARIIAHLVQPERILIGVEDNKPEAIEALQREAADSGIEVPVFPTKYPSGGEKQLIELLTGRQVPSGGLPADIGVVCQNVGTAVAVYDAVVRGRPLISRVTTVTGRAVSDPGNFQVLLGTPMAYLLERAGFHPTASQRLIMGGPMMGFTVPDPQAPVVKTTNCLLVPTPEELPLPAPAQACIRCGLCAEVCPASLLPQQLYWFAQGREFDKAEQHNLFDCIECGACSYVCPSNIPLVQYYRAAKAEIQQQRVEQEKSEQSRLRFEARQERLAREEQEKAERRAARRKAAEQRARQQAASGSGDEDPVQAAIERAKAKKAALQRDTGDGGNQRDKLERAVVSARRRLQTAETKFGEAQAEGSDLAEALQAGLEKTRARLEKAEQALRDYSEAGGGGAGYFAAGGPPEGEAAAAEAPDPARDAIARAMAAREAEAALSPAERARNQLHKLRQRLEKSETRLAEGQAAGEEDKIIEALEATVERLRQKVADAEAALPAEEDA